MICDNCKTDRIVDDFINNQKLCYRCIYQKKIENSQGMRKRKVNFCRMCGKEVIHKENLKKRQRTVFCSCECAQKGHKELMSKHWTRQVRSGRVFNGF